MKNNNVLEYADIPQVAMNDVHKEELGIVNNINSAIVGGNVSEIYQLCQKWLEHTKERARNNFPKF